MERKLTAILSADVKGYSRFMEENEKASLHTLRVYRKDIVDGSDAIVIEVGSRVWQTIIRRRVHRGADAVSY